MRWVYIYAYIYTYQDITYHRDAMIAKDEHELNSQNGLEFFKAMSQQNVVFSKPACKPFYNIGDLCQQCRIGSSHGVLTID